MEVIQFVPKLPNSDDGIAAYALNLAHHFVGTGDFTSRFIAYDDPRQEDACIHPFKSTHLSKLLVDGELDAHITDAQTIIFHFNYIGSSKKVTNLLQIIQTIKRLTSIHLIIMFHELKVTTKLRGDFEIFNPRHFWATFQIARAADVLITNNAETQFVLCRWTGKEVLSIPVFSNVGEPLAAPLVSQRQRRMVVFGARASRLRVYNLFSQELFESCRCLSIDEICDIGNPIGKTVNVPEGIRFNAMGFQSNQVVSELLLSSLAGFIDYSTFPKKLAKSGIYAAYCAHGTIPVCSAGNVSEADGICLNKHYLVAGKQRIKQISERELQDISNNITRWYSSHSFSKTCELLSDLIA